MSKSKPAMKLNKVFQLPILWLFVDGLVDVGCLVVWLFGCLVVCLFVCLFVFLVVVLVVSYLQRYCLCFRLW